MVRRVFLIVLDSAGVGALPDAALYGDEGSNTLGNLSRAVRLRLPMLGRMGLGNILTLEGTPPDAAPLAWHGKMAERSPGKDTTTGHWEMAGVILERPFPVYPHGFPEELIAEFEARIGRGVLGNKPASGTEIIAELGEEHVRTGYPIVYTSADSVFQIAAHEDVIPLERLYEYCASAREMLGGEHAVGRVIARPFVGSPGAFVRTPHRRDYSWPPPRPMLLDLLEEAGILTVGVGKIHDVFVERGISESFPTESNTQGIQTVTRLAAEKPGGVGGWRGLVFANLVDFDMLFGHRNDIEGYARALEEFDAGLPGLLRLLGPGDALIITADHGCDPTTTSTDHSREHVPLMVYVPGRTPGGSLGIRSSFSDVGKTVAEWFGVRNALPGDSFSSAILGD